MKLNYFFNFNSTWKIYFEFFFEHNQNYKQSLSKYLLLTRTIYLTKKNLRWLNSNKHPNLMIFHFLFLIRLSKELIAVVRISKQFLYKVQRDLEIFFLRFLKFVLFVYEKNQIKIRIKMPVDYSLLRILSYFEWKHDNILKKPCIYFY